MIANPPLTDRADEDPATAPPATEPTEGPAPSRHADLQAAAARIRAARGLRLPVEQVLLVAAAILFPLGLIFILLGWEGASHTGRTYAQLDYLISGGIFGLGLSVAGGFMYFGYWLSRQLGEARRQTALTVQALQRLEGLLEAAVTPRMNGNGALRPAPAPIPARAPGAARPPGQPGRTPGPGAADGGRPPPIPTPPGRCRRWDGRPSSPPREEPSCTGGTALWWPGVTT
jgi:hypothetical protein